MPGKKYRSIKNPKVYEALRRQGMSKQRAARISNAQAHKSERSAGILTENAIRGFRQKVADLMAQGMSEDDAAETVLRLANSHMMTGTVKDAGTSAGSPLSGPGGLLGVPGMGSVKRRKWGNRTKRKDCTCGVNVATKEQIAPGVTRIRGNLCNVHGRYGPCDGGASAAKKPKGRKPRKGRKPVKTTAQRQQERAATQAANSKKVFSEVGLSTADTSALEALRSGSQADAASLVKKGLAEQAADGSYRLTPAGRALSNAAKAGDTGRARDIMSAAQDRKGASDQRKQTAADKKNQAAVDKWKKQAAREQRQAEAKKRREEAAKKRAQAGKKRSGSSSSQSSSSGGASSSSREAERQEDRKRRQAEHAADRAQRQRERQEDRQQRLRERAEDRAARQADRTTRQSQSRMSSSRPAPIKPRRKPGPRTKTKAQSAEDRAMFAKMGGGGKGGGSKLWPKGPSGKRTPQAAAAESRTSSKPKKDEDHALPQSLAKMSRSQHLATVDTLSKMPLSELRRRQQLVADQRKMAHREYEKHGTSERLDRAMSNLEVMDNHIRSAIDRQVFGSKKNKDKSFTVYKSDSGYRWIARSTTAYRDRDKEILTIAALDADSQRMTATKTYGPLRFWHLGKPDPFDLTAPWGPGVDIGDCDYSTQIGTSRVESGTFRDPAIAERIAQTADQYELSPGFFHPSNQPNKDGEYTDIRTFERSIVPVKYGRASNLYTGMTIKEFRMEPDEMERRFKAAIEQLQLSPEQASTLAAGLVQADKSAQAQGVAYKSDDQKAAETAGALAEADRWIGVITAIKAAMTPAPEEKAAMPPAEMVEAGETELDDGLDDEADEEGDYVGDMSVSAFEQMLSAAFQTALAPLVKSLDIADKMAGHMDELKSMMSGATTKAAGDTAEIAALKSQLADIATKLKTLQGDQPSIVLPDEIMEALKSSGPATPPDPNAPVVPNDPSRPFAALAAVSAPQLYRQNGDGSFAGWQQPTGTN